MYRRASGVKVSAIFSDTFRMFGEVKPRRFGSRLDLQWVGCGKEFSHLENMALFGFGIF